MNSEALVLFKIKKLKFSSILWFGLIPSFFSQISLDGTLGSAGQLSGPNFDITADLGQQVGANLFHSFSEFSLINGEVATFFGPNSVENIVSRVTGPNPSNIDGTLRSDIEGSNVYFVNPNGVFFGPNAQLDISGSFVASTADYIGLKNGGRFDASNPDNEILTSAPVGTFGFMDTDITAVGLDGTLLAVPQNESISIVSGQFQVTSGRLQAPSGQVNVVAVGSPSEVQLEVKQGITEINTDPVDQFADIEITASSEINVDGEGGGGVLVQGENLSLEDSIISSRTEGDLDGRDIDISISNNLNVIRGLITTQSENTGNAGTVSINAESIIFDGKNMVGDGGILTNSVRPVENLSLTLDIIHTFDSDLESVLFSPSTTAIQLFSNIGEDGDNFTNTILSDEGEIAVTDASAPFSGIFKPEEPLSNLKDENAIGIWSLQIKDQDPSLDDGILSRWSLSVNGVEFTAFDTPREIDGSELVSSNIVVSSPSKGGDIHINGTTISLKNGVRFDATGNGGGKITIAADNLNVGNSSLLSSNSTGSLDGGPIKLNLAKGLVVEGMSEISSVTIGSGNGGDVSIVSEFVQLTGGSRIGVGTSGTGVSGKINIAAEKDISVSGEFSQVTSRNLGERGPGVVPEGFVNITLSSDKLEIMNGGTILANSSGSSQKVSIEVNANKILIDGQGAFFPPTGFLVDAIAGPIDGEGGEVVVNTKTLTLVNGGIITAMSLGDSDGGTISIDAEHITIDGKQSPFLLTGITADTFDGPNGIGEGGSIAINSKTMEILGGGTITASTTGNRNGGNITIVADDLTLNSNGFGVRRTNIRTESLFGGGNGGDISIEAGTIEIIHGARITSITSGIGNGGNIFIEAETTFLDGLGDVLTGISVDSIKEINGGQSGNVFINSGKIAVLNNSSISAITAGDGPGGMIKVSAEELEISSFGGISSSTLGPGKGGIVSIDSKFITFNGGSLSAFATSSGEGGTISITARDLRFNTGQILSLSSASGNAGDINIDSSGIIILEGSSISAEAFESSGGNIFITVPFTLQLSNSEITAAANNDGGNITIDPEFVILNKSHIIASAVEGNGGNIDIITNHFIRSDDSSVTASSQFGLQGNISISVPDLDLAGSLVKLDVSLLEATSQLLEHCSVRIPGNQSSFIQIGRGGLPWLPDVWQADFSENKEQ